jgi:predicted Zn-dependent protease with MMP-like domain
MACHVSKADFSRLVEQALEELPEQFREFLEEVPVQIMDRPSPKLLKVWDLMRTSCCSGCTRGLI